MSEIGPQDSPCEPGSGCCPPGPGPSRREFLQIVGLGAAGAIAGAGGSGRAIAAGPFEAADFEKLVPRDKKLSPEWVRSLTDRGEPTAYRGAELATIGMPVGGIGAGQVYLGGDGTLWHWDIFNRLRPTGDANYAHPPRPDSPFRQGFAIRVSRDGGAKGEARPLDHRGFPDITFMGQYPIGRVEYRDEALPVAVTLEAFSPFIPLNADDSSLPATILSYTVKNTGSQRVEVEIAGWLENAVGLDTGGGSPLIRRSRVRRFAGLTCLECSAEAPPESEARPPRADVGFDDFEAETYEGWTATGTAFGAGPIEAAKMPGYQGEVGAHGKRLVNTHNARQGEDVARGDAHTGTLTSRPFVIDRPFINFLIGGGDHKGKTCLNLLVDGKPVLSATGRRQNRLAPASFDVRAWQGRTARLQIVDDAAGEWGNVGVDRIVFSDRPAAAVLPLRDRPDHGTMALALIGAGEGVRATAALPDDRVPPGVFAGDAVEEEARPFGKPLVGSIGRTLALRPGEAATVTFVIAWHFPNLRLDGLTTEGRWYATKFPSAVAVAEFVSHHFDRLAGQTRLWRDTWYDSTLPHWFLDRTFLNASILATSTCYRFGTGRFYGWEGVGCCPGTCTHVWHYAQAVARLFPELERDTRERVDLGLAFDPKTGIVDHRGEFHAGEAVDGQAGVVLRCYREHQMAADDAFLRRNWPHIKAAIQRLIDKDGDADGILEGPQHNTLDAAWFGVIPWLSGLYHAALRAGEELARERGDAAFAGRCRAIFEAGRAKLDARTWKEEYGYFVQVPDPTHLDAVGSFAGCAIDQVLGQGWADQVGLGPVMAPAHVRGALAALWRYNFTPDVGPYRAAHKAGRWYALAGEGGLLMVTHPFGPGPTFTGKADAWSAMYFNECMTGFEHQVAGQMIGAGMLTEGLAIERTIHDRYHPARRNPWNEVECGDHYARAMASHGVFLAACGFAAHGPKGHIGFAPRISPADFRAPFTTAEGWGTFAQAIRPGRLIATIRPKSGHLRIKTVALELPEGAEAGAIEVTSGGEALPATLAQDGRRVLVTLGAEARVEAGQAIELTIRHRG